MSTRRNSEWPLPFAKPEEVGVSSERLARIRPALQRFIDQQKVPNLVTLVARHGKVVHFDAQGYMDFDSKKPAPKDTIFRLYSNSKPITGVATMILYEEGRLNLDDPVSKYIPAFKNPAVLVSNTAEGAVVNPLSMIATVPARRGITIRDCLRNTTGLVTPQRAPMSFMTGFRDVMIGLGWYPGSTPSLATFRERVEAQAKLPLSFQPGTEFEYHVGYPVIGVVIETIVGKTLEEFYQERIFRPLGMKDTSFYLPERKLNRFPACYQPKREGREWKLAVVERPETSEKVKGPKVYFGAGGDMGGILSTVADYARFAQMLLNGGELDGARILSRKTVELMTASHTGNIFIPMVGHGFGFGMGVGVHTGGRWAPRIRSVGAYGWGGAAGTTYFADPKEDLLAVCFTQVLTHLMMPENTYQEDFERLVYQALL
jgi:CubicO group peptidase (beta-lactamase class C family)